MRRHSSPTDTRPGAVVPLTAILLIPLMAFVALAIDLGYVMLTRTQLQAAADASALAASSKILTNYSADQQADARQAAARFAGANRAGDASVQLDTLTDVQFGFWDAQARTFGAPRNSDPNVRINAVRVLARRDTSSRGGALPLFFARVLGINTWNVSAEAVALVPNPVPSRRATGVGTRFLIDDEMFDTDEPVIQNLANRLGQTPEHLLRARNEKSVNPADWFLNIPPNTTLEVPTGQVGDEALFDIDANLGNPNLPDYPFRTQEMHNRFLYFNETSESDVVSMIRRNLLTDSQLDPLRGVGRYNQPSLYPELVNPDFVHVSPVYKSDVSALDGVENIDKEKGPDLNKDGKPDGYTTNKPFENGVNAKGYRRGLIAFRIIGYRIDPAKPYPYLPNLIIEVLDPSQIDLSRVTPGGGEVVYTAGGIKNVRLAR